MKSVLFGEADDLYEVGFTPRRREGSLPSANHLPQLPITRDADSAVADGFACGLALLVEVAVLHENAVPISSSLDIVFSRTLLTGVLLDVLANLLHGKLPLLRRDCRQVRRVLLFRVAHTSLGAPPFVPFSTPRAFAARGHLLPNVNVLRAISALPYTLRSNFWTFPDDLGGLLNSFA